jgi:hypothetical protein
MECSSLSPSTLGRIISLANPRFAPDHPAHDLQLDDTIGAMLAHECPQLPVKFARRVHVHAVAGEPIAGVEGFYILVHRLSKPYGRRRVQTG